MILNLYSGEDLLENADLISFFESISSSILFYFLLIFGIFLVIVLFVFVIKPLLFKQNPEQIYQKYKRLREDMERIDILYRQNKIGFEDYVFAQFNNAKEYEQVILLLSKYPEYQSKIKNYKIEYTKQKEVKESKLSKEELMLMKKVSLLYNVLSPFVKYYTKNELIQGVLDEGYNLKVANALVNRFSQNNLIFAAEHRKRESKTAKVINKMFGVKEQEEVIEKPVKKIPDVQEKQPKTIEETYVKEKPTPYKGYKDFDSLEESIDISSLNQKEKPNVFEEKTDVKSFKFIDNVEKRQSFFSRLFKKKPKKPTVDQINDIFKDIGDHINN